MRTHESFFFFSFNSINFGDTRHDDMRDVRPSPFLSVCLQLQVGGASSAKAQPKMCPECQLQLVLMSDAGDEPPLLFFLKTGRNSVSLCVKATLGVNLKRSECVDFITQRPFVFFWGGGGLVSVRCERCVRGSWRQVHVSPSNKTGRSLPTWTDGCTFS